MWRSSTRLLGLAVVLGGCSGGDGNDTQAEPLCEKTVGRWALGDDNLFMEVVAGCTVSNFCSVREGIHTRGKVTDSELKLDSVGGGPLVFSYTLTGDMLTIIDGNGSTDLPLRRVTLPLPTTCPSPP